MKPLQQMHGIAQIKAHNAQLREALLATRSALQGALDENELLHRRLSTAADKQILLPNKLIDHDTHLNAADVLPPVDCPLLIEVAPGRLVKAERTGHVASRGNEMEYRVSDGNVIMGRLRWTYP